MGLPRRQRDVVILLASATLWMETGAVYSESEINAGLDRWRRTVCSPLRLDVVTLRRELVDRHVLDRDDAGSHYSPAPGPSSWRFSDDVGSIDPASVIAAANTARKARKQAHLTHEQET
jgi:hypothetical protein